MQIAILQNTKLVMENDIQKKYLKLQKISQGSYGVVYKARNIQTEQIVAIKKFKNITNEGIPVSCIRELNILNLLKNCQPEQIQRTLTIYDISYHKQSILMVVEWLDQTLSDIMKNHQHYDKKKTFRDVVKSLKQLHQQCILHRDIKPPNIMISHASGIIKIIDYGMSRQEEFDNRLMTNEVGSLYYRAPELILGEDRYSFEVDIWSLGCVFYQILTKKIMFKGENQMEQMRIILEVIGTNNGGKLIEKIAKLKNIKQYQENWSVIATQIADPQALNLLKSMLTLDPSKRPNVQTILNHSYFSENLA